MEEMQKTMKGDTFTRSNNSAFLELVSYVSGQLNSIQPNNTGGQTSSTTQSTQAQSQSK